MVAVGWSVWPSSQAPAHTEELLQDGDADVDPCHPSQQSLAAWPEEDKAQLVQLQQLMSLSEIQKDQTALKKMIGALQKKNGPSGRRGRPGPPGVCGPGSPGDAGTPGGPGGNAGPGRPGRPGKKGKDGVNGRNGRRGVKGANGAPGYPGRPGLPGKPGLSGQPGPSGRNGRPGKAGLRGAKGTMGATGRTGAVGPLGRRGVIGKRGPIGHRGRKGRVGQPGKTGIGGFRGKRGKTGGNGGRGRPGKRGNHGVVGKKGPKGGNGLDKHVTRERGHVIGMVLDAVTGLPLAGARLTMKQGRRPSTATRSKDNGRYYLALNPGTYKIVGTKGGYVPATRKVTMKGVAVRRVDVVMSPKLRGDQTRFILTWKDPELGLGTYLRVPPGKCVVSGITKRCTSPNHGLAVYDQEKCAGRGPQTITIRRWSAGRYYLWVKQLSVYGKLVGARAVVRVIHKNKTTVHRIQKWGKMVGKPGKNSVWCVLKMEGKMMLKGNRGGIMDCAKVSMMEVQKKVRHNEQKVRKKIAKKAIRKTMTKLTPPRPRPSGTLEGKVINVANGKTMRFVKVKLWRKGSYVAQAMSNARGYYKIKIPFGQYQVMGHRTKFTATKEGASVVKKKNYKDVYLSPKLHPGELRIVLRWSNTPRDIDSYLKTPDKCIVWYKHRHCHKRGGRADLDVDNTRGKGPETITIHKCIPGDYYYFVKQYSRRGSMALSQSLVQVYYPSGRVKQMKVGKFGKFVGRRGRGRTWLVFKFNCATGRVRNGKIVPKKRSKVPKRPEGPSRRRRGQRRRRRRAMPLPRRRRSMITKEKTNIQIKRQPRKRRPRRSSRRRRTRRRRSRRRRKTRQRTRVHIKKRRTKRRPRTTVRTNIRIRTSKGGKTQKRTNVRIRNKGGRVGQCVSCQNPLTFLKKHDYQGSDLIRGGVSANSPADCCKKCRQNRRCRYWTYGTHRPRKGRCWLKKNSKGSQRQSNRESGRVCKRKNRRHRRG